MYTGRKSLGQFSPQDDWGLDLTLDFPENGTSINDIEPNNIPEGQSAAAAGSEGVVTGETPVVPPKKAEFPMGLLVVAGLAAYLLMKR